MFFSLVYVTSFSTRYVLQNRYIINGSFLLVLLLYLVQTKPMIWLQHMVCNGLVVKPSGNYTPVH